MIEVETLRKLLRYEPGTGKLYWLPRTPDLCDSPKAAKIFNRRYAGTEAFTFTTVAGYKQGRIFYDGFQAHRVIWAIKTGKWPTKEIDHINGDPSDNRWVNLREATRSENAKNIRSHKDSNSKFLGVSWSRKERVWQLNITNKLGKVVRVGAFKDETEAALARDRAAVANHGKFARLNFHSRPRH